MLKTRHYKCWLSLIHYGSKRNKKTPINNDGNIVTHNLNYIFFLFSFFFFLLETNTESHTQKGEGNIFDTSLKTSYEAKCPSLSTFALLQ